MATLGTTFAGAYLAMPSKSGEKETRPPINAASKDEEKFIQYANLLLPAGQHLRILEYRLPYPQGLFKERQRWGAEGKRVMRRTRRGLCIPLPFNLSAHSESACYEDERHIRPACTEDRLKAGS